MLLDVSLLYQVLENLIRPAMLLHSTIQAMFCSSINILPRALWYLLLLQRERVTRDFYGGTLGKLVLRMCRVGLMEARTGADPETARLSLGRPRSMEGEVRGAIDFHLTNVDLASSPIARWSVKACRGCVR